MRRVDRLAVVAAAAGLVTTAGDDRHAARAARWIGHGGCCRRSSSSASRRRRRPTRHAAGVSGERDAAAVAVAATTAIVERVGTRTGVPFGRYEYSGALRPQIAGVPAIVPLAWFAMAVPAREATHAALGGRSTAVTRVLVGAAALTAWDLFLDPQMVGEGYWSWVRNGRLSRHPGQQLRRLVRHQRRRDADPRTHPPRDVQSLHRGLTPMQQLSPARRWSGSTRSWR